MSTQHLYLLEVSKGNEKFYKIGICTNSVKNRYDSEIAFKYDIRILVDIILPTTQAKAIEKAVKSAYKTYRYLPKDYFGGSATECFSILPTVSMNPEVNRYDCVDSKLTMVTTEYQYNGEIDFKFLYEMKEKLELLDIFSFKKQDKNPDLLDKYALSNAKLLKGLSADRESFQFMAKSLRNFFANISNSKSIENIWTCPHIAKEAFSGMGYTKGYVPLYKKVDSFYTTKYGAFAANPFPSYDFTEEYGGSKEYKNQFVLMVFFIWLNNSAFYNDEKVMVYIPAKRVRDILEEFRGLRSIEEWR